MTQTYVTAAHLQRVRDQLTPLDHDLIRTLATVSYATTRQLEQLVLRDTSALARARRVRRRLQHLRALRVVHTHQRQIGGIGGGSPQSVHTLDRAGLRLTASTTRQRLRAARDRGRAHVLHAIDVTQHLVDLHAHAAGRPGIRVVGWLGEPACHIPYRELGRLAWLAPDATVTVDTPSERITSMLEVDRGTESLPTLLHKADRYLTYAKSHPDTPQVVFSLLHPERVARLVRALHDPRRPRHAARLAGQLFVVTTRHQASAALAGEEVPR